MIFLGKHAGNPNKRVVGLICFCWLEDLPSFPWSSWFIQRGGKCATVRWWQRSCTFSKWRCPLPGVPTTRWGGLGIMVFSDWHHKSWFEQFFKSKSSKVYVYVYFVYLLCSYTHAYSNTCRDSVLPATISTKSNIRTHSHTNSWVVNVFRIFKGVEPTVYFFEV